MNNLQLYKQYNEVLLPIIILPSSLEDATKHNK